MTNEELEKKAKDYAKHFDYCSLNECALDRCERAYKDGYKQGQKEILEQCSQYHGENKTCLIERVAKVAEENEELKAQIEKDLIDYDCEFQRLKVQIEKMKNCYNCKFSEWSDDEDFLDCIRPNKTTESCFNKNKWELAE